MNVPTVTLSGPALMGVGAHLVPHAMMAALPQTVRLGRIRAVSTPPVLQAAYYYDQSRHTGLSTPTNWRAKAAVAIARMYLNDVKGDCVMAGKFHALGVWSANDSDSPGIIQATDAEVLAQYESICGPGDQGCVITQVLDVFRSKGLRANGKIYTIDGYVAVDWTNQALVWACQQLFGASTIGINLPNAWTQNAVWDTTTSPIVGGHDVTPIDVDDRGVYVASWGRIYLITWRAYLSRQWLEEMYALLSNTWYNADRIAPSGFDAATLATDLTKLAGGTIPPTDPPQPVPPDPNPLPPPAPNPPPTPVPVPVPVPPTTPVLSLSAPVQKGVYSCGGKTKITFSTAVPAGSYPITYLHKEEDLMHTYDFEVQDVQNVISPTTSLGVRLNSGTWLAGFAAQQFAPGTAAVKNGEQEMRRLLQMHAASGLSGNWLQSFDWAAILQEVLTILITASK